LLIICRCRSNLSDNTFCQVFVNVDLEVLNYFKFPIFYMLLFLFFCFYLWVCFCLKRFFFIAWFLDRYLYDLDCTTYSSGYLMVGNLRVSITLGKSRLKYLFGPYFCSVCCGWSSFWHNVQNGPHFLPND